MSGDLNFELGPTQFKFVMSEAQIVMLMSGFGEGKTFAGVVAAIAHAARCGHNIRGCLIRDTFTNLKTSTIPDIKDYLGPWCQFSDGEKKLTIKCTPSVELDLFGIDDHASISKLQGPQYAFAWLEEPAPIFEKANAGLPREVFNLVLARAARQRNTIMRVQITQNPADDEHWTSLLAEEPEEYMVADDGTIIRKEVFTIPRGENFHLNPMARAATQAAFKDDPAKWARYVEGKIAAVYAGKAAVPAYNPTAHFSDKVLPVFKGEGLQFWDGWMHPCCILAQYRAIDSMGGARQLVIHDVLYDEGVGTRELIREQIEPMLKTPKWKDKIRDWRIIGDPSMASPDQTSAKSSPRREIEDKFQSRFEAGPVSWHARQEPLNNAFKVGLNNGNPSILLSRSAVRLHKALKGAWHYKVDNNGNIIGDKPIQNSASSHPGNALSYGIAVLMPYELRKEMKKVAVMDRQKRAMSYGSSNLRRAVPSAPPTPGLMR